MSRYKAHTEARLYFGIYGNYNLVLHHIDTNLKETDIDRYN